MAGCEACLLGDLGLSASLSGTMSTTSSEKHPVRPCSPTPGMGVVAAALMELEGPLAGNRLGPVRSPQLALLLNFLARKNYTTIWDSLVPRQKARSCMWCTTLSRGKATGFTIANIFDHFKRNSV